MITTVSRSKAMFYHAMFKAGFWFCWIVSLFSAGLVAALGFEASLVWLFFAFSLALCSLAISTATDLWTFRIPNPISALPLLCAVIWWSAVGFGVAPDEGTGRALTTVYFFLDVEQSSLVPEVRTSFLSTVGFDVLMAILVFVPLLLSFILGLGFSAGDVKFMTAFSLFLGWSLSLDFVFLSFVFGGIMSMGFVIWRRVCRVRVSKDENAPLWAKRFAKMRSFPYAPAIAIAGVISLASKMEGLF